MSFCFYLKSYLGIWLNGVINVGKLDDAVVTTTPFTDAENERLSLVFLDTFCTLGVNLA